VVIISLGRSSRWPARLTLRCSFLSSTLNPFEAGWHPRPKVWGLKAGEVVAIGSGTLALRVGGLGPVRKKSGLTQMARPAWVHAQCGRP